MAKLAGIALSVLLLSVTGFLPYHADAQTQTTYLSYENKQYGFSIKYPSDWEKTEILSETLVPNMMHVVLFSSPSKMTNYHVFLIKGDTTFSGLSGQKFFDKIKEKFVDPKCSRASPEITCSTEILQQSPATHKNGYNGYTNSFSLNTSSDKHSLKSIIEAGYYPDGDNVWIISSFTSPTVEDQQYVNELSTIGDSFTIFNYEGMPKQFLLQSKASQKNDIVYLVIKNPKDSSDNIYGIKLTNMDGKITKFIKIKDWTYKRLGSDSVIYQTTSSPLNSSDLIKVALKVDSKNTEIQWEAFSKDKTSLGTGKVKP